MTYYLQKRRLSIDRSYSTSAVTPSEKNSLVTNRKSTKNFPLSLRWTAYVASKPPKGAWKRKMAIFSYQIRTIICDNFETVQGWM